MFINGYQIYWRGLPIKNWFVKPTWIGGLLRLGPIGIADFKYRH